MKPASWPRPAAILLTLLLTACSGTQPFFQLDPPKQTALASPQESAETALLRRTAAMQDRLDRVAGTLLVANAGLCKGKARNLLGISARNKYSYSSRLAEPAERAFGLDGRLQVANVLPGSGADNAGVKRGDVLISVEGKSMPQGENAESEAVALLAPLVAKKASVKLAVLRNNGEQSMTVPLTRACGFRVELGNSDSVNSYSDGSRILVTRGMMQFTQNDEELAYVVAKEMAHNVLEHSSLLKNAPVAAGIIDRLVRGEAEPASTASLKPIPQKYDIASDALSLHIAARAGYGVDRAEKFWQRLAAQYPASVPDSHTALHPASSARFAAMTKAIPKIKAAEEKRKAAANATPSS